jgi:ETFB lysine methyltransferase
VNAWRNGGKAATTTGPGGLMLDWRNLPDTLERFDVVVASDVLYERPYGALVAQALAATLADGGIAWLADPGRVAREAFIRALGPLRLRVADRTKVAFKDGSIEQSITIFEVRHQ